MLFDAFCLHLMGKLNIIRKLMSQTHLVMNKLQWLYHIHEGVVLKHAAVTQDIRKRVSKVASQRCH